MALSRLWIKDFRNLAQAELGLCPRLNLIHGANGAGKTSILEAVFFLGRTRSFVTRHSEALIRRDCESLQVRGQLSAADGRMVPVGVAKDSHGLQVRLDGAPLKSLGELVPWFPLQLINPASHELLEGGPQQRRRYMDWGVFHVEPGFYPLWQRYRRVLQQRNAALRSRAPDRQVQIWDQEFLETARQIDQYRREYLQRLESPLQAYETDLLGKGKISLQYQPGWSAKQGLEDSLSQGLARDRERGFTRLGPHRADFVLCINGEGVREQVSRGQQKQLVLTLLLAQASLFSDMTRRPCLFLVDDLAAELDRDHRERVLSALRMLEAQVFVTAIEPQSLAGMDWGDHRVFHVEHGQVTESDTMR